MNKNDDIGPQGTDLIDIFAGPPSPTAGAAGAAGAGAIPAPASSLQGQQEKQITKSASELIIPDVTTITTDEQSLTLLIAELRRLPDERHADVLAAYKDLLLSDNLTFLLRRISQEESDYDIRLLYKKVTDAATMALQELSALVSSESVRHLETIMQVCEVAALYQQDEEEFLARMEPLRPYFDTALLGSVPCHPFPLSSSRGLYSLSLYPLVPD